MRAVFILSCLFFEAVCQADLPELDLQAGGHTSAVRWMKFTPDGKTLITTAQDGFVRFWDVNDSAQPRLARALKIQTGQSNPGGSLFACDISPDGRWLAVAGMMDRFYVIDIRSHRVVSIGRDHFTRIGDTRFSPDGRYLAMCGLDFVDVWPVAKLIPQMEPANSSGMIEVGPGVRHGYRYSCNGVSWKQNGRDLQLLVSGWKASQYFKIPQSSGAALIPSTRFPRRGRERLSNKLLRNALCTKDGRWVVTLAKSPRENSYSSLALWDADGDFVRELNSAGQTLREPICLNSDGTAVAGVTTSNDGSRRKTQLMEFSLNEAGRQSTLPPLMEPMAYSMDNRWLSGSSRQGYEVVLRDRVSGQQSVIAPRGDLPGKVRFSADGDSIGWEWLKFKSQADVDCVFDLATFRPTVFPDGKATDTKWRKKLTTDRRTSVQHDPKSSQVTVSINGVQTIGSSVQTYVRDVELLPGGRQVILGGNLLVMYDVQTGRPVRQFGGFAETASVSGIAVSGDGRTLVTSHTDQVVRMWDLQSSADPAKPMLSLFVTKDGRDYIAWTQEGYYAASTGGHELISWSVASGPHQLYETVSSWQYRNLLYRPDVVELIPVARTTARALTLAASYQNSRREPMLSVANDQGQLAVPMITIKSPGPLAIIQDDIVSLKGSVRSKGTLPIAEIRVTVNKRPVLIHECLETVKQARSQPPLQQINFEFDVPLLPNGPNTVEVSAATRGAASKPHSLEVVSEIKSITKPNLYLLGVGVAEYQQADMQLAFPDDDVASVAAALMSQQGRFYEKVVVDELINDDVTERNIRRALKQLTQKVTQHDVTIVMVSGHGHADDQGGFYFCPHDFDPEEPEITGFPWEMLTEPLTQLPCKVLLCIDTCYAAGVLEQPREGLRGKSTARRRRSAFESAINQLRSVDPALVVLTSSTDQQESFEKDAWGHGAFALSLIEVLTGKHRVEGSRISLPADINQDRFLEISEIDSYVTARVKELTNGRQQPVTDRGRAPSFPIAVAR